MLLHRNCRSCCMVRVFLPLCLAVESCCSWQGEKGKFFSFCIRCCISVPSLMTTPVKPNAPCTRCLSGFACCPLGTVCPGDFRGCQHLSPLCRPPSGCSFQLVPVPQCSILLSAGFATGCCFHGCIPTSDTCRLWLWCILLFASSA